jgi:hypothetical protein
MRGTRRNRPRDMSAGAVRAHPRRMAARGAEAAGGVAGANGGTRCATADMNLAAASMPVRTAAVFARCGVGHRHHDEQQHSGRHAHSSLPHRYLPGNSRSAA